MGPVAARAIPAAVAMMIASQPAILLRSAVASVTSAATTSWRVLDIDGHLTTSWRVLDVDGDLTAAVMTSLGAARGDSRGGELATCPRQM